MDILLNHRRVVAAALLASMLTPGCFSERYARQKHEFRVDSDRPDATVYVERDGEKVSLGKAKDFVGEYEYEARGYEYGPGMWIGGIGMALAGGAMAVAGGMGGDSDSAVPLVTIGAVVLLGGISLFGAGLAYQGDADMAVRRICPNEFFEPCDDGFTHYDFYEPFHEDDPETYLKALPPVMLTIEHPDAGSRQVALRSEKIAKVRLGGDGAIGPDRPNTNQDPKNDAATGLVRGAPQPTSYALVIGLDTYRELPSPRGAKQDAEDIAQVLEVTLGLPKKNIKLLLNDRATRGDILAQIAWLEANVPDGGRIYVFFSGHGSPEMTTGQPYLLPYEASADSLKFTGLDLQRDVLAPLEKTRAREVLAFVDACFSGQGERSVIKDGARPLVPVKRPEAGVQVAVFASAGPDEISGPSEDGKNGLFTSHIVDALGHAKADADGDGQVSLLELDQYVTPRVERDAQRDQRKQRPTMSLGAKVSTPANVIVVWGVSAQ